MRKPGAVGLVVVVLLSATTAPAVALQGDPPEHAGGDGPPEHAEGGGEGPPVGDGPSNDEDEADAEVTDDGDGGGDATEGEDERAAGDDDEAADGTDGSDGGDGRDDSTVTDEPADTEDAGPGPTETDTSLLPLGDEDDSTPAGSEEVETRTAEDDDPPIPTIGGDDAEPTSTPDDEPSPTPDDEPSPTPDDEPSPTSTAAAEDATATPSGDGDDSESSGGGDSNPWSMVGSNDSEDSDDSAPVDGPIEVANVEVVDAGNGSGGERTVRATAENTGERESTRTVAATVDGETVATREVTLAPGEAATLAFDLPAGAGTVAVGGLEAEQHRARGTDPGAVPAAASSNGDLAFGVGAAVLVVLAAAGTGLLAARHEDWEP